MWPEAASDTAMPMRMAALFKAVDEALFHLWDPIGVAEVAAAHEVRDEYCGYVAAVVAALQQGMDAQALAAYLDMLAREQMGIEGRDISKKSQVTGNALLDCYRHWQA
ncbi:hypothetical protein CO612_02975 [Lysobacteraceae bacterium NML71-0210]|nr:hypothetical protein CO612_02975 [Xanthomonadaceae bacterium NML71-0210]